MFGDWMKKMSLDELREIQNSTRNIRKDNGEYHYGMCVKPTQRDIHIAGSGYNNVNGKLECRTPTPCTTTIY